MGFVAKRVNDYTVGVWAASKVQSLVSMVILLKLFDAPSWAYFAIAPVIALIIWFTGFILVKTGFWARVTRETYRDSLYKDG